MKSALKCLLKLSLVGLMFGFLVCCATAEETNTVDYAALRLNMNSETVKQKVTVKAFVDGDTTHFNVPADVMESGVLKARFLAINTPEITGKIEEYGKRAAEFTKEKLSQATSIIIESDDSQWNRDSTGERFLVWVWYQTADSPEYRNLNIEILQNGLAIANSSANNRYGAACMNAITQAREQKLAIYSGQKDPDFYYGEAIELTLREIRCNLEEYVGKKVAFKGVITMNSNNSVYLEEYDAETDMYYGISVYYGYNLSGKGLEILRVGNESRIVGTVQYYEAGNAYQVSGIDYWAMRPRDPGNIQKISEGHRPAYVPTSIATFLQGQVEIQGETETRTFDYADLAQATSIEMKGLTVQDIYTTTEEESASKGAMTLICQADGLTVQVRTAVFYDENNSLITAERYLGKVIDVRGIVDCFEGIDQIKVFTPAGITIQE